MFEVKPRSTSYVGVYSDRKNDAVIVWERDENGKRKVVPYQAPYYFYVPDEDGEYTSIFGDKLKRLDFEGFNEYEQGMNQNRVRFESDFSPLQRVLMDNYYESPNPNIHFLFYDLEVDYDSTLGFSSPDNAYAPINANTVYQSWTKKYITTAVLPKCLKKKFNRKKFDKFVESIAKTHKLFAVPDVEIMVDEAQLLTRFIDDIEDADIISGWNSEFFDVPYTVKRLEKVRPKLLQRMCFPGCKPPREKIVERFGTPSITYQLQGRSHLDYLDLFKKFTFEGRTSYSLGSITSDELDAPKMEHEGTLEQLYNGTFNPVTDGYSWSTVDAMRTDVLENLTMRRALLSAELRARSLGKVQDRDLEQYSDDQIQAMFDEVNDDVEHCSFATFCCYNAHDVGCLVGLDDKFKFMALVNQMAHENTCEFKDLLGTVRYVETGITNRAHYVRKKVVMDKKVMTDGEKVEGALVLTPFAGLHKKLGAVDLESLYPSVIRALGISPENFVGQFTTGEQAWRGIKNMSDDMFTLLDDTGETITMSGEEWWGVLIDNGWVISGYGTVFNLGDGQGIVDETLSFWFAERKRLKKELSNWKNKRKEITGSSITLSDEDNTQLLKMLNSD